MRFEKKTAAQRRRRSVALATLVLLAVTGCASPPAGPRFLRAEAPNASRARLYIYRGDVRSSLSQLRVSVDGRPIGLFRDGEYDTLELSPGRHTLRVGLRGFGFVAWGWNEQQVTIDPGKTVFVKLSVRLTERAQPGGRDLEIAGRTSGAVSENVYLQQQGETEALRALASTTRRTE